MPQLNTATDLGTLVNPVYADALLVARENSVMPQLVTTFTDMTGNALRKNAKYGTIVFNQMGETDDMTSQAFTPSVDQTLTAYEYGAQAFMSDLRIESDPWQTRQDVTQELGVSLGVKVDTYLASCFSSFSAGTAGTANGDLTWNYFLQAISKMYAAFAPRPWVAVLSPFQWQSLATAVAPGVTMTNAPVLQDEIMRTYWVSNVAGVDVFIDANVSGHNTGTCVGGIFSRSAVALDWRRSPRMEVERDASRRGFEINMSAVFAYGVWRPQFGVAIRTAGTLVA